MRKFFKKSSFMVVITIFMMLFSNFNILAKRCDWGIWFSEPGKSIGDDTPEYLKNFNAYFIGEEHKKIIYLTFDAGYENGYTDEVLDILKENKVPATFFLCGHYFKKNPEMVKRMVEEGHTIGNHTMSHPDMSSITDKDAFKKELSQVEDLYRSITGHEMKKFYRPPMGKYSENNLKIAKDLGYSTIFWSLAYKDYDNESQPSKKEAFAKLIPNIHPGAVILLHNTSKTNSLILDELIKSYTKMGYEFRELDDLIG